MSNLFDRMATMLNRNMEIVAAQTVTYTRGGIAYTVTAELGRYDADAQQTTPPARVEWTERDWVITAANWTVAGLSGTPAEGDRITATLAGQSMTFKVQRRGTEPAWQHNNDCTAYRIHTKPV